MHEFVRYKDLCTACFQKVRPRPLGKVCTHCLGTTAPNKIWILDDFCPVCKGEGGEGRPVAEDFEMRSDTNRMMSADEMRTMLSGGV